MQKYKFFEIEQLIQDMEMFYALSKDDFAKRTDTNKMSKRFSEIALYGSQYPAGSVQLLFLAHQFVILKGANLECVDNLEEEITSLFLHIQDHRAWHTIGAFNQNEASVAQEEKARRTIFSLNHLILSYKNLDKEIYERCIFILGKMSQIQPFADASFRDFVSAASAKKTIKKIGHKGGLKNKGKKISQLPIVMEVLVALLPAKTLKTTTTESRLYEVLNDKIENLNDALESKQISCTVNGGYLEISKNGKQPVSMKMVSSLKIFRRAKKKFGLRSASQPK
jgi:hypothetical protein